MPTGRRCCAIPRCWTRISANISKPRTTTPRACSATPPACRRRWSRKCAGASRKTIPACPRRTGPTPICASSARAASTRCSAACRADGGEAAIILDGDKLAADHTYFRFGGARHSPDHKLQAWSADIKGSEYFSVRVRDWTDGADRDDLVEETDGTVVWSADSQQLLLRQARRQPPPDAGLAPSARHAAGGRYSDLSRKRIPAGSPISMRAPAAGSASSPAATMRRRSSG